MLRSTLIFSGLSSVSVAAVFGTWGWTPEVASYAVGLIIFTANLILWTVIVRELLDGAAHSAQMRYETELASQLSQAPFKQPEVGSGEGRSETEKDPESPGPQKRGQGLIITAMALKVSILGGGIYVCLAVFKLLPIYFAGGLAAGLGFFAVASFVGRK